MSYHIIPSGVGKCTMPPEPDFKNLSIVITFETVPVAGSYGYHSRSLEASEFEESRP